AGRLLRQRPHVGGGGDEHATARLAGLVGQAVDERRHAARAGHGNHGPARDAEAAEEAGPPSGPGAVSRRVWTGPPSGPGAVSRRVWTGPPSGPGAVSWRVWTHRPL